MKNGSLKDIIADIRTHLEYQKMMGVEELPRQRGRKQEAGSRKQEAGSRKQEAGSRKPLDRARGKQETGKRAQTLEAIRADIGDCKRCKLCKERNNIVFGVGNPQAGLMFVGEGPGYDEDQQGEPFVGRAGQLLTKIIGAMKLKRGDVYIGNSVKCRPPGNRNPEPDEIETCIPFLMRQIESIRPKIIVCLGAVAAKSLLNTEVPISRLRGKFIEWSPPGDSSLVIKVLPTYHPAFLLRNPAMKRPVWEDMQKVMKELL